MAVTGRQFPASCCSSCVNDIHPQAATESIHQGTQPSIPQKARSFQLLFAACTILSGSCQLPSGSFQVPSGSLPNTVRVIPGTILLVSITVRVVPGTILLVSTTIRVVPHTIRPVSTTVRVIPITIRLVSLPTRRCSAPALNVARAAAIPFPRGIADMVGFVLLKSLCLETLHCRFFGIRDRNPFTIHPNCEKTFNVIVSDNVAEIFA